MRYLAEHLDSEKTVQSKSKVARSKTSKQKVVGQPKKTETPAPCMGDDFLKNISEQKREALCAYIYDLMTRKGLTSPAGYLVVDVISNVWRDMFTSDERAPSWAEGKQRFVSLFRSAPKYFEVLEKGLPAGTIRVAIRRNLGRN
jgi:hypothetical protein